MDRPDNDNRLTERILNSPRLAVLLLGPAGSGKTSAVLAVYRRLLDPAGRPGCLLLAPCAAAVTYLRSKLLADSPPGVVVSPQVLTFSGLAGRILAAAGRRCPVLSPFRRRLLLRRIVDDLLRTGKLAAFAGVADTPGLIVSLDRAVAELKRAAIEPDALGRAVDRANATSADLLEVYRRYQQALLSENTYDVEGLAWQVRDLLTHAASTNLPLPGMEGVQAVAADGFTDFTPTQLRILSLLAKRLPRVLITLPHARDGRDRMWHWTARTLGRIGREFPQGLQEIQMPPRPSPMRPLWDALLVPDASAGTLPDSVCLIAAAGPEAEVAAVARRIKRLLVNGDSSARPAGRIALLARSLETYRGLIERTFRAHDIPLAPAPQPLSEVPIIRFALDVAGLAPDFGFRDVLRVIANSYFRPEALGDFGQTEVAAADMIVREGNVLAGRESYSAAASRLARRRTTQQDDEQEDSPAAARGPSADVLRSACRMLAKLFDLATATKDARDLLSLIDALELRRAALGTGQAELIGRDLRALGELASAIGGVPGPAPQIAHVREALAAVVCPPARTESLIDVLDVLDARAIRYAHVFLLGLSEGAFPRKFTESSLIRQADREAWKRHDLELDSRGDLTAREMLLFYLALSRADETLTVSFLESDASGKAQAPSSFLLSMLEPFGGLGAAEKFSRVHRIPPGGLLPPTDEIASPQDAFNAAIAGLFDAGTEGSAPALAWATRHAPAKITRAAMGLFARHCRYLTGQPDRFDGRISDPAIIDRLSQAYLGGAIFSASQFNAYGQCPWLFLATYVLRLKPIKEPQRRLEAIGSGLFAHKVLFGAMRRLAERSASPLRLADVDEPAVLGALNDAIEAESAEIELHQVLYPALWRIQKEQIRRHLGAYLLGQRARYDKAEQLHFELGFGVTDVVPGATDPSGSRQTVSIDTPAGEVKVSGRIDRVDRVEFQGASGLLVIDYKTGRLPTQADMAAGRSLQLPIYAVAVEKLLGTSSVGGAFHQVVDNTERHFSAIKPPRGESRSFDERRGDAAATIGKFVELMAAGRFDLTPTSDCPGYCPFRQICHYSPARAEVKAAHHEGPT